ncbi:RodZ family helix-turn-helix domain-containing protein [Paracraurococcus ruber]|uniref:PepSY domain-containing protein n=1 Tax=Paracraurococcus ruber TaxID=77675 RepID=A0ABS1CWY0_9PROT|nr:hypothetical protein [Paracraurococcus ruber]MBK1659036.1 hypothetical protein [Paracraurococcus ruber]TDG31296.1 hypothetical protein E2C05_11435 [Paracraurococcus ruber]
MRKTLFRLALLGAVAAVPAYAQTSPATPDRTAPGAATQGSTTRPNAAVTPAPDARSGATAVTPTPDARTGATTPNRDTDSGNAAVRLDDGTRTATTPAAGANSFTEGQAKSRIEAAGFTDVSGLQKDDQGVWRGRASRGGQQVSVALDFQGNVVPNAGR